MNWIKRDLKEKFIADDYHEITKILFDFGVEEERVC